MAIVLSILGPTPIGSVAFLGSAGGILILSIVLTIRARAAQAPPPSPPPAAAQPM